MALMEKLRIRKSLEKEMDLTLFQTPEYGQEKGYSQVFRTIILSRSHEEALNFLFKKFSVPDLMPNEFNGRFMGTGDIVLIDEYRGGQHYFQLKSGGWKKINRVHLR